MVFHGPGCKYPSPLVENHKRNMGHAMENKAHIEVLWGSWHAGAEVMTKNYHVEVYLR